MSNQKLRVWRTAGLSSVLALRTIRTFPLTWLFVVAALFAIRIYRFPEAWHELPAFALWGSVLGMLARSAVLTPFAILIHRWIVLGESEKSYWAMLTPARAVRFLSALFLLTLVEFLPQLVAGWLHRPVDELMLVLCGSLAASAILWTRLCLGFPIIATDDNATLPFRESLYVTNGSSWRIFFAFFIIGAVETAFLVLYGALGTGVRASLWFEAAGTAAHTIFFVTYVAAASHLWRTRGDWSDRGRAVAAAWTTSAIS
jgi:hypothetical protein